jgi:N6-L-threonylcarbamoyladenine synthase
MPCFLAGDCQASVLASALHVPLYRFSHQQGHIAAVLWSANRLELLRESFLAWHLSGGTTELLLVTPEGPGFRCDCIGGTTDISAGQLIDRTGQRLSLDFPAGKALDQLAARSQTEEHFSVKRRELTFSLSGMENQVQRRLDNDTPPEDVARFVLNTLADLLRRVTDAALERYPGLPVLCSGGVASNRLLRERLTGAVFAEPRYSTDNAMGIALLTRRALEAL